MPNPTPSPALAVDAIERCLFPKTLHSRTAHLRECPCCRQTWTEGYPEHHQRACKALEARAQLTALQQAVADAQKDTERLNWLGAISTVGETEDGERVGLWITDSDSETIPAIAIIADITGDDGAVLPEDAPFWSEQRRAEFNRHRMFHGPEALREAIDAAMLAARTPDPAREEQSDEVLG